MADNSSAGAGGKGGGSDLIAGPKITEAEIHPQGLLSAIGMIEDQYENEKGGAIIPPGRFTTPRRVEFMEVGARTGFAASLGMTLLTPLAIGVLDKYIPIFGSFTPSLFDQLCGVVLAVVFPMTYSFLFAGAALKHLGGYTRAMVNNLLCGMAIASFLKAFVAFLAFHFIYFKILTDKNIAWVINKLHIFKLPYDYAVTLFIWVKDFKSVFITGSYFILVNTLIFVSIPYLAFYGHT